MGTSVNHQAQRHAECELESISDRHLTFSFTSSVWGSAASIYELFNWELQLE